MFWGVHLDKFVTYVKDPEILLLAGVQSQSCQSPESRLFRTLEPGSMTGQRVRPDRGGQRRDRFPARCDQVRGS